MTDRDTLLAGRCPICDNGPFRVVLNHVTHAHKIRRSEARARFGLAWDETVCSPEHADLRRIQIQRQRAAGQVLAGGVRRTIHTCAGCGSSFEARTWPPPPRFCSERCSRKRRAEP